MIWYIAMWPTSQVLEDLHESLGVTSYILLVSLGQTAFLMPYVIIICNAARMLRRNKTDASPPTAVAS
jgi:hypothetical protein